MERLLKLEKDFNEVRSDVSEIKFALLGNKANGNIGLLHRFGENINHVAEIQKYIEQEKIRTSVREAREKKFFGLIKVFGVVIALLSLVLAYYKK